MKIFVAGATGAIGKRLVPCLLERGHQVVAMTHRPAAVEGLRGLGAEPVVADALERAEVVAAVERAGPDVVVHQLTALTHLRSLRSFDAQFAVTNRLRTEATDHLLAGARAAGARRFVAQSYGNWIYERTGSPAKTEEDRLDPSPPRKQRESFEAIRYLENAVVGGDGGGIAGVALRYGAFYGPGTGLARDGDQAELVRHRKFPVVGGGEGVWSFLHVDDAASATVAAIESDVRGIYNVADDDPAPVREWLPALARALGAKPPHRVPVWLGRLAAGEVGVSMLTRVRGMSNEKARRELGWRPRFASWREGFVAALGEGGSAPAEPAVP